MNLNLYEESFPPLPTPPVTRETVPTPPPNFKDKKASSGEEKSDFDDSDAYNMALDDVHTRFLLNLPANELSSVDRIFFQLEQAYWFYDDFYCDNHDENSNEPPLPRFKNLRQFCATMFQISPLLSPSIKNFNSMWDEFAAYKRSISTFGTILLNEDCTKVVLCQDWSGKSWTLPAGKINQHETGIEAGARETYEETGFDINCQLGLTKEMDVTWKKLIAKDALTYVEDGTNKQRTCYVCRGVPEDFPFEPVARKEVSDIQWFDLNELPKKTFAVLPFVGQLRKWIRKKGYGGGSRGRAKPGSNPGSTNVTPSRNQSAGKQRSVKGKNNSQKRGKRNKSRNNSRGKVREGDSVTKSGLASIGDKDGWTEEEMFNANEKILGRPIEYDGNPHTFADAMANLNPHKFHIVGGSFMNSKGKKGHVIGGKDMLAEPPDESALQPLFNKLFSSSGSEASCSDLSKSSSDEERKFQPFFSDGGKTPWGEVVKETEEIEDSNSNPPLGFGSNKKGLELLNIIQKDSVKGRTVDKPDKEIRKPKVQPKKLVTPKDEDNGQDAMFLTDKEITARSQKKKLGGNRISVEKKKNKPRDVLTMIHENEDFKYLQNWAKNLERPPPSKHFGDFRFDVDAIMEAMNKAIQ